MASTPRIDTVEGLSNIAASLAQAQGLSTLIDTSSTNLISVPSTTIVNRAPIVNLANDVGVRLGINRVMTQQIYPLQSETGPNGELVWGVLNDVAGQIRFVGNDWSSITALTEGPHIDSSQGLLNDFVEVTFYGVALNMLMDFHNTGFDIRVSVDGGAEGANIIPASKALLNGQSYSANQIISVVSGLTLALHTVKMRVNQSSFSQRIYGFEMIHQSGTSSNLIVNPGTVIGVNRKGTLSAQQLLAYNSGFETGSLGTTGGRVLAYLKSDNTVGRAITPAAASPSYLASASHTSEEVVRVCYFREFGANKSDDFSTLTTGSNRSFTLDDGTTTLCGVTARVPTNGGTDCFSVQAGTSNFFSITFVGTGLDLFAKNDFDTTTRSATVTVDGVNAGTLSVVGSTGVLASQTYKVVSGLPYGTHVVTFTNPSGSTDTFEVSAFKIYQPLTPTLPSTAIELCRYNIVANYVANATAGLANMATGTLRKVSGREWFFQGSGWSVGSADTPNFVSGRNISTTTSGDSASYTFFGSGFELRWLSPAASGQQLSVTVDGLAMTVGNFASLVTSTYGPGISYSGNTLTNGNGTQTKGVGFSANGLGLGFHTVKFTITAGATNWYLDAIDIITPVHSYKNNAPSDSQNSLLVGSQGINDSRSVSALAKSKAWVQAVGVSSGPSTSSSVFIPMPDMSVVITTTGNPIEIKYSATLGITSGGIQMYTLLMIDGVVGPEKWSTADAGHQATNSDSYIVAVNPGVHKIDLFWRVNNPTMQAAGVDRTLNVREI